MGSFLLPHAGSLKHLQITTSVLVFALYPTGLLPGTEGGTLFKLGMGEEMRAALPSIFYFFLSFNFPLSNSSISLCPLPLWIYRSAQLLDFSSVSWSAPLFSCRKFVLFWYLFAHDSWPSPILTFCSVIAQHLFFSALYCISNLWLSLTINIISLKLKYVLFPVVISL